MDGVMTIFLVLHIVVYGRQYTRQQDDWWHVHARCACKRISI